MDSKKIKKQLRLAEDPDTELLALLEGVEDRPARVSQFGYTPTTPETIQARLEHEFIAQSVGELINHARRQRGLTLEQIGQSLDVGKGRMSQIEKTGANLELQTLARVAKALDYELKISFVSKQKNQPDLEHEVISAFGS